MRRTFTLIFLLCLGVFTTLKAQLNCAFTPSATQGCPPFNVVFTPQQTGGGYTHYWEFDNGNTSTSTIPTASYSSSGIFNVMHVIISGAQRDTCYQQIRVFVPAAPDFISADNNGCVQPCHMVHFTNTSIPGESPIAEAVWNFGDGGLPISAYNAQHCYSTPGTYNVTLIVRDTNNCQTSITKPNFVVIGSGPTVNINSTTPTQSCTAPTNVAFTSSGSSPNGAISYSWNFGNGFSSQQNPTQAFQSGIYDPYVVATDPFGCQDTAFTHVEITVVQAGFTANTTNACSGIAVQFTDTSNFASSWAWTFGDGGTSFAKNPTHTYNATGTYTVTLTVTYNGCSDSYTATNYINVTNPVPVSFTAPDTSDCAAPLTINFSSTAPGAATYAWTFGDGGTDATANPAHTYNANGVYTVSLSVTNSAGCVTTLSKPAYIHIGDIHALFTADSTHGCAPTLIRFTNASTSNGPITTYAWDFGDGGTASTANPFHVYTNAGTYAVTLTITNAEGCTNSYTLPDSIKIGQALTPAFIANPLIQCIDQTITFTNNTLNTGPQTTYLWNFGDGQTSTQFSPTHEYSDTGHYDITLTVINQGCSATLVKLKYIQIVVPRADFVFNFNCASPTTVDFRDTSVGADSWFWDFGDGTSSTQPSPTHTFPAQGNYTITLVVYNATTGCTDSTKKQLPIGTPSAGFGSNVTSGCASLTVSFSDSSVFASAWNWDFGDGTPVSNAQKPTHIYSDTGRYTVTLIINPGQICSDTVRKVNYITVYGTKPRIVADPPLGCVPFTSQLKDSSTTYAGTVVAWTWVFSATDSSFVKNPSYTFTNAGVSVISLHTADNHGCKAVASMSITGRSITASFTADSIACPGESIQFNNLTTNTAAGTLSYQWLFGDNSSSTLSNPTHAYLQSGAYYPTLIVTSSGSCTDTFVMATPIQVDTPIADFYVTSNFSPCPPFPVQFYNSTNRTDLKWLWYFGDGDTSTAFEPLHVYFFPGDYDVTLIAWDSSGCVDTITYIDLIRVRGPIGNFTLTPDSGCVPLTVSISGSVQSTVHIVADLGDGVSFQDTIGLTHTYNNAGNYYPVYTLTDSVGCVVAYPIDTVVVGIIPYPNLPPDTTVCKGNYVQFNVPVGDFFQWSSNLSQTYLTCDTCRDPVSMAPDTITYYVTATTTLGCQAKDTITVNVDALPQIFPGISYRVCPGDTLQLSAGPNVTAATWTPNIFINDTNLVNPQVWPPDTTVYRVTGANATGCTISRIVRVYAITKVDADILEDTVLVCEGTSVPLHAVLYEGSANDTSFFWRPAIYLNDNTLQSPTLIAPPGVYDYSVIVSSSTCLPDTDVVHVTIGATPDLEAGDDQTVAVGTTIQLYAASPGNITYLWKPTTDSLSCTSCRRPFITANQTQTVYVSAINEFGCKALDSVQIRVVGCDPNWIFIPNTFTPNDDGLNDKLFVRGIGLRKLEYFRVFDRWGHLVYEGKDVNDGWDGKINGKAAEIATYVYLVKGECTSGNTIEKQGNVTLIR
ncbi:MAG: PKD domain-containing protein [Chitinophagales bacterium]